MKDKITALAGQGLTRRQAADALGMNYTTFCKTCLRHGISRLFNDASYALRQKVAVAGWKKRKGARS